MGLRSSGGTFGEARKRERRKANCICLDFRFRLYEYL